VLLGFLLGFDLDALAFLLVVEAPLPFLKPLTPPLYGYLGNIDLSRTRRLSLLLLLCLVWPVMLFSYHYLYGNRAVFYSLIYVFFRIL
jgi:hypothetical protein